MGPESLHSYTQSIYQPSTTSQSIWTENGRIEDDEGTYGSDMDSMREVDEDEPTDRPTVHPMTSMQAAFEESIAESVQDHDNPPEEREILDARERRQKMIEQDEYDETYAAQWRSRPRAKHHPLWKIMAQISFGVHLLHQQLAKSDTEVVKILQKHVDEVDTYLEKTTEDFDLAQSDIKERINYLALPLKHIGIFDGMLEDKQFRVSIIDGNQKIERIVDRTMRATDDALLDVSTGIEAVTELATYLNDVCGRWEDSDEKTMAICHAMRGNAEGWYRYFRSLQVKGNDLVSVLGHLTSILNEMSKRARVADGRIKSHSISSSNGIITAASSRSTTPSLQMPTSRFSPGIANKPLPRPPRSHSSTAHSSRDSSHRYAPVRHPQNLHYQTSQRRTMPAHSFSRHQSTRQSRPQQPFREKFEQVRSAPAPPPTMASQRSTAAPSVASKIASAASSAPKRQKSTPARPVPDTTKAKQSPARRSTSILKRIRMISNKESVPDLPTQKPSKETLSKKHGRSMTSDLADLFRAAGETPRDSRFLPEVAVASENPPMPSIDGNDKILRSSFVPGRKARESHSQKQVDQIPNSRLTDSAYFSGEKEFAGPATTQNELGGSIAGGETLSQARYGGAPSGSANDPAEADSRPISPVRAIAELPAETPPLAMRQSLDAKVNPFEDPTEKEEPEEVKADDAVTEQAGEEAPAPAAEPSPALDEPAAPENREAPDGETSRAPSVDQDRTNFNAESAEVVEKAIDQDTAPLSSTTEVAENKSPQPEESTLEESLQDAMQRVLQLDVQASTEDTAQQASRDVEPATPQDAVQVIVQEFDVNNEERPVETTNETADTLVSPSTPDHNLGDTTPAMFSHVFPPPQTPKSRMNLGLFPSSRPMTPKAASLHSNATHEQKYAELAGSPVLPSVDRAASMHSPAAKSEKLAPPVSKHRQRRSMSMGLGLPKELFTKGEEKEKEKDGSAEDPVARTKSLRKRSSFNKLKDWIGRKSASPSTLGQVEE